ncbi:MAG: HAMP domain-containing histidine kinase [Lachnospiraceae bacterium]|nr:HAMP domain-containing histidine kinase [Lachnospiraceae bacterium]
MKFSYKILFCTMIIMAIAFGASGYYFVNYVFDSSMEREVGQALDESSILQFAFETAALNIPSKYDVLQDSAVEEIGVKLEASGQGGRLLRISDEERKALYTSEGFVEETDFLAQIDAQTRTYQIVQSKDRYYVQTGSTIDTLDRVLYLETLKDVTDVFEERTQGFHIYRRVTVLMLLCSSVIMWGIAVWLTKPIRLLTKATQKMAEGDYSYRAERISQDEMGQLTTDFNRMANALEENVEQLENEVRAREDFIGAFSHELKTPLTAIIGYADLLRSRKLDDETHFLSANYIYTEGKRLETMAFRLLDIVVMKRSQLELATSDVAELFDYLKEMYAANEEYRLDIQYAPGQICAEVNLLKSVLLNLVDNACKASEPGNPIEIRGIRQEGGYLFLVKDYGVGIPAEECKRITEAFYMVDKSRSRSRNGAGLGLSLCAQVLSLHHSELMIESTVGEGSCFSFLIPDSKEEDHA